jgi:hypothetical protein
MAVNRKWGDAMSQWKGVEAHDGQLAKLWSHRRKVTPTNRNLSNCDDGGKTKGHASYIWGGAG